MKFMLAFCYRLDNGCEYWAIDRFYAYDHAIEAWKAKRYFDRDNGFKYWSWEHNQNKTQIDVGIWVEKKGA